MFRQKDTLNMHVCSKNTSQKIYIYMYVQVARYLGYACIQQKYLTKHIYVCLGSKIPWICMYIAKILYVCLGSKIPHEKRESKKKASKKRIKRKKKKQKIKNNKGCLAKKQYACEKR